MVISKFLHLNLYFLSAIYRNSSHRRSVLCRYFTCWPRRSWLSCARQLRVVSGISYMIAHSPEISWQYLVYAYHLISLIFKRDDKNTATQPDIWSYKTHNLHFRLWIQTWRNLNCLVGMARSRGSSTRIWNKVWNNSPQNDSEVLPRLLKQSNHH